MVTFFTHKRWRIVNSQMMSIRRLRTSSKDRLFRQQCNYLIYLLGNSVHNLLILFETWSFQNSLASPSSWPISQTRSPQSLRSICGDLQGQFEPQPSDTEQPNQGSKPPPSSTNPPNINTTRKKYMKLLKYLKTGSL